jgi:neural Wiskott-Aldrich syndrome protein
MIAEEFGRIPMSPYLTATLARAADYAKAQLHRDVTLEHVLLSLAEDPEASVILKSSNIDIGRLMADVSSYLGRLDERVATADEAGAAISLDLRRVLEAAAAAAGQGRRREINGAIVLAAIVGDGKSPSAHILRSQGLTFEEAIRALQKAASPPASPSGSAPRAGTADDVLASARERTRGTLPTPQNTMPSIQSPADFAGVGAPPPPPAERPMGEEKPLSSYQPAPVASPPAPMPAPRPGPPLVTELAAPAPLPPSSFTPAPAPALAPQNAGWPPQQSQPQMAPPPQQSRSPFPPLSPAQMRAPPPSQQAPAPQQMPYGLPPFGLPPAVARPPMPPQNQPAPWAVDGSGMRPQPGPRSAPPYDDAMARLDARRPQHQPVQQGRPAQAPAQLGRGAPGVMVQAGQLAENIPRKMRVALPVIVEARIARAEIKALADGMQGDGAVHRHELPITKAMSVRLRAPEGGFYIETASPETQWIENVVGLMSNDYASWRWSVTPKIAGRKRLQLVIGARTVGGDGLAAETALPDQIVEVQVGINFAKTALKWGVWIAAAVVGGVLARFGEGLFDLVSTVLGLG